MVKYSIIISLCLFSLIGFAQSTWEKLHIGMSAGLSNYQGDLVDRLYKSSKGVFGFNLEYELGNRVMLRGSLNFAKIAGADSLSDKSSLRSRNLSFQSSIQEASLVGEFYTFDLNVKRWSPYVFAGLGIFHFNPYTIDNRGNLVYLRPLTTEGEGLAGYNVKPYSLFQVSIPFGGGIKFGLSPNVRLGLEIGIRKTFTDYLDDVSGQYPDAGQLLTIKGKEAVSVSYRGDEIPGGNPAFPAKGTERGNPSSKDYYYFTTFSISVRLKGNSSYIGGYGHRHRDVNCPTSPL